MRAMLATDWVKEKVIFPVIGQPKIDGVRGLCVDDSLVGRSLKCFANDHTVEYYSRVVLNGLDGELYCGNVTDLDLCRKTTSALNTIEGRPQINWMIFDIWELQDKPYEHRLEQVHFRVDWLNQHTELTGRIGAIDWLVLNTMDELEEYEEGCVNAGYEGVILRNAARTYKNGRSTVKEGGLLRIKRTTKEEAIVVGVNEGQTNLNEATTDLLGYKTRTSHAENMVPNGMVGSLDCLDIKTGDLITVSAGRLTHKERVLYFEQQELIIGKIISYKKFPHGQKDKPRQPTFQHFRMKEDYD